MHVSSCLDPMKRYLLPIVILLLTVAVSPAIVGCGTEAPLAGIGVEGSARSGGAPLEVHFYDQSWGTVDSWYWDFGDGNASMEQNPVHTYEQTGAYTVSLTASNSAGASTRTRTDYIRVNPTATMETSMGTIKFELYQQRVPNTVENFIKLAESGFYDGLIFHRVIDDFVIQTGDPTGTGAGGSDETINLEIVDELTHVDGAVAMARSGDLNSASSQFYICDGEQPDLDGNYTVFGQVFEGMSVVREIASVATDDDDKPLENVTVISITIHKG